MPTLLFHGMAACRRGFFAGSSLFGSDSWAVQHSRSLVARLGAVVDKPPSQFYSHGVSPFTSAERKGCQACRGSTSLHDWEILI